MEQSMAIVKFFVFAMLVVASDAFIAGRFDNDVAPLVRNRRSSENGFATITQFHVKSLVTTRYARVRVTSVVRNDAEVAKAVSVEMRLPKAAFISNFSMDIEGQVYVGIVKEKAAAKAQYKAAVARGQSAGLVTANTRESQTFDVSVNVAAGGNVTFQLDYEELLKRRLSVYNHVIYADPGQIVDDCNIEVHISEPSGITLVEADAKSEKTKKQKNSFDLESISDVRIRRSSTQAYISYRPSRKEQKLLSRFNVKYDVTREQLGGDLLIRNGYFVHFFAPDHLPVIPKKVVFVIDRSGSMAGQKMRQTKEALRIILDDLKPQDQFNIITFSDNVKSWQSGELMTVNDFNIGRAKDFVNQIHAYGGTNFNSAAQDGVALLETVSMNPTNSLDGASMLILLTDGQPTSGVTSTSEIRRSLLERVAGRYSVFCLGFGPNVDHKFLDKLATENQGLSRRIYGDADAALQLKGFYDEVASPMLAHVIINYTGTPVVDVSKTSFDNFFEGSEILVVGRIIEPPSPRPRSEVLDALVGGDSVDGKVTLVTQGEQIPETFVDEEFSMEKIWAYLTVKQLLREKTFADRERKNEIDARVLRLSTTHNFVTDLTSMVVTKPSDDTVVVDDTTIPIPTPAVMPRIGGMSRYTSFGRSYGGYGSRGGSHRTSGGSYRFRHRSRGGSRFAGRLHVTSGRVIPMGASQSIQNHPLPMPGAGVYSPFLPSLQLPAFPLSTTTTATEAPTTTLPPTTTQATTLEPVPPPANPLGIASNCGSDTEITMSLNVTSPQHPGLYPTNTQCVWRFFKSTPAAVNPTQIKLTFPSFDLEDEANCSRDRVLVYPDFDAAQTNPEILTFCGFQSIPTVVNARDELVVVFQSDDVVQGRGFLINLQVEDFAI
uniref:Inter-alpha-trypsin inhibitor heavy chain H4 n=1 Tax=Phallusia mammillata TaxID=59560 RepID=A0A6F9DG23_9ASCI|nr:inter-alpha-trypsin inhibitor heavy chain H4 [Phallusia mammillata]